MLELRTKAVRGLSVLRRYALAPHSVGFPTVQRRRYSLDLFDDSLEEAPAVYGPGMRTVGQVREKLRKVFGSAEPMSLETLAGLSERLQERAKLGFVPQKINQLKTQAVIPLSSNRRLRNKYLSSVYKLRVGRLLEDIDTCAVWTSVEHAKQLIDEKTGRFPLVVVTALADRINLRNVERSHEHDIRITGQVTWVGTTSLEVTLNVDQQRDAAPGSISDSGWSHLVEARLLMVARQPSFGCGKSKSAVPFVQLVADADDADGQLVLQQARARRARRKAAAERSLLKTVPGPQETKLIHELFLRTIDEQKMTFRQRIKPENANWISETGIKAAVVCHPEERNVYNKIFGGFLMRQALELAWITARRFSTNARPTLIAIDDLVFQKPVEIGSTLFLSSFVVYRPPDANRLVVRVNAEVVTMDAESRTEEQHLTNTAYIVYEVPSDAKLRDVYPETYAQSVMYLDGKRHYEDIMETHPSASSK